MFGQSGFLTLLGMGMVFGFLLILIICVTLVGKLIHRLGLDQEEQTPKAAASGAVINAAAVTAAITAAVTEYRKSY
jgi:oxaloacetate decarboxylase gamma subunit